MTERSPSITNHSTYPSQRYQEEPENLGFSPNLEYRKVASRRRKNLASLIGDPDSPQPPPFPPTISPNLPILPPPMSTSIQIPFSNASHQSPTDPLPFSRHSAPIHLPSPDMLAHPRHSVPPPLSVLPTLANMTTSTISAGQLSNSYPTTSVIERSSSLSLESTEELSHYSLADLSVGETSPTKGRNEEVRGLTSDERKQRRLLRNRLAAKECRKKKKAYVMELENKVQQLEGENSRLKTEIQQLNGKLQSS
ncbi:hypothetical protein K493DRAFT_384382 [Basidiobolus meristosporus CBS 931.73]|uniref:BZIP domain-containing protein n=1 Tax=Basidiobolus meristosporus CBS 931.73 TaxID=1314790 RepID=A0A1Y1ZDE0_9FUNG|nr:hypothetical protein K493DRAFT_384382 [Basidiobolus meristosporus CBS 931.73]|eukprot:ORY07835.1 hypothetical protein K493DRAFT_384382 [Basidiobolus meristosporus CBS 931.73]